MGINKPLVVIASLLTALMLTLTIVSLVIGMDQPHPEANVITQKFMEEYTHWKMWKDLGSVTLVWTLISAFVIVMGIAWGVVDTGNETTDLVIHCVLFIPLIIWGLWIQPVSIFNIQEMANAKPRVQTAYISRKYYKDDLTKYIPTRHIHRSTASYRHYYFVYSNGASEEVMHNQYENNSTGEQYYLIMCNNTIVGRFDTDIYTIK